MNRHSTLLALSILAVMLLLMLASVWNESATMDELAHIPAGYGYVAERDYRLNPEHPPLLKALAGLSARIAANPRFPIETEYWQTYVNGQWDQGRAFLYESGNDADQIIFWSRFPLILLTVVFGWLLFGWVRKRFGSAPALLTLVLFAFSPTFLAHSRYVTTDLGAAFGFFAGITVFLWFLEKPTWQRVALLGVTLGAVELVKYSLALLVLMYAVLLLVWVAVAPRLHLHERIWGAARLVGKTLVAGLVGILLIWGVYAVFTANYPHARQIRDSEFILASFPSRSLADLNLALVRNPTTRAFGHYLLGFLMVSQRAGGGNTGYFLGDVSSSGSRIYFPLLYLLKEPLPLHILTLIALWFAIWSMWRARGAQWSSRMRQWIYAHFTEFAALVAIAVYWLSSLASPLNIGVRHVLPTFPFIYLLVSRKIVEWLGAHAVVEPSNWMGWLRTLYALYLKPIPRYLLVALLLVWVVLGTVTVFPHFLAFYNELAPFVARAASTTATGNDLSRMGLAGGTRHGYRIAVDSNYDWGQDLKRLRDFVQENHIEKIALDYFGGGSPRYYLGDRFEPWWSARGPASGWFAISATFRQGAFGTPVPGFERRPEDSYPWLAPFEPIARAGYSIFIYKLP